MDFELGEEQRAIGDLAREILSAEATHERVKQAEARPGSPDRELWAKLAEASLLGIAIPEAYGGMGYGFAELCVLLQEIGRQAPPIPALATLVLGALPLAERGSPAQREAILPNVASGETLLSAGLVDADSARADAPAAGPDAPATRARADGDGFVLDGAKRGVPWANHADLILVPATTPIGPRVFLVDPGADGVETIAGLTSTGEPSCELNLSAARVGAQALLGGPETGSRGELEWIEERALVALAALQVGVSERALEIMADYVREREQFGRPIGSFQAVQHRAADGFIDLQAMRWTMWHAAWRIGQGLPARREAWVAKFWAADAGSRIANAALHLHGGIGSDVDYPIQRYFLWSKALELNLGGAGPQLATLGSDMARTGPQEQP